MKQLGCLNDYSYAVCLNGAGVVRLSDYVKYDHHIGFPLVYKETFTGIELKRLLPLPMSMVVKFMVIL